ncbi:MAG: hypothetical protein ACI9MC_003220 [Kiritimatiellia bacterium]|jgi:hypothetical protein
MSLRGTLLLSIALTSACSGYQSTVGPDHCGAIGDGEVWGKDLSPHNVTCDVTVEGDLTIGPGTTIQFAGQSALLVHGSLYIEGTDKDPVTMEAKDGSDQWVGVYVLGNPDGESRLFPDPSDLPVEVGGGDVRIEHLQITGAGVRTSLSHGGGLIVERGPVHVKNVTIDGTPDCGLLLLEGGRLSVDSEAITLRENDTAICAHTQAISSLDSATFTMEGSTKEGVEVIGDEITGLHVWNDLGVPYIIGEDLAVWRGSLEIGAGTTLELKSGVSLSVGRDQDGPTYGQTPSGGSAMVRLQRSDLLLSGTADSPVTITTSGTEYWGRLIVDVGSTAGKDDDGLDVEVFEGGITMNNVVLDKGGRVVTEPESAAVLVTRRRGFVHADGLTIQGSESGGFWFDGGGFDASSRNVVVTGGAYIGRVTPDGASTIPSDGSTYTGNAVGEPVGERSGDVIYVADGAVETSGSWRDHGVPWQLEGGVRVGFGSDQVIWTVQAGNELHLPSDSAIVVGQNGPAGLMFGEQDGDEVLLTYGQWGAEGSHWSSLVFESQTVGTELHNTRLHLSGSTEDTAAMFLRSSPAEKVLLDGLTIEDPEHVGFLLWAPLATGSKGLTVKGAAKVGEAVLDVAYSVPETDADLSSNDSAFVEVSGRRMLSGGTWGDIGIPYRIYNRITVNGYRDNDEVRHNAVLTLLAGSVVEFDQDAALQADDYVGVQYDGVGSVRALGAVDNPVTLRPFDASGHWVGMVIRDEDPELPETKSVLQHLHIVGGGRTALGALVLVDATPVVESVTISRAETHGLYLGNTSFLEDVNEDSSYWGPDEDSFYDAHEPPWFLWGQGDQQNNPDWVESEANPDRDVSDRRPWSLTEPSDI